MQPVIAAAFCPSLLQLPESQAGQQGPSAGLVQLPYSMVFALATLDSLLLYSTQVQLVLGHSSCMVLWVGQALSNVL